MDRWRPCSQEGAGLLMPDTLASEWYEKFMDIVQRHESSTLLKRRGDSWATRQMDNCADSSCLLNM